METRILPRTVARASRGPYKNRPGKPDDAAVVRAIVAARSAADALRRLGMDPTGANYARVRRVLRSYAPDTSHWTGQGWRRGTREECFLPLHPLEAVFTERSTFRGSLRKRVLREGLVSYRCALCGAAPEWQGRPLTLVLDHVNGVADDNRVENLRFVCPNCNSQLPTHAGRNRGKYFAHARRWRA